VGIEWGGNGQRTSGVEENCVGSNGPTRTVVLEMKKKMKKKKKKKKCN